MPTSGCRWTYRRSRRYFSRHVAALPSTPMRKGLVMVTAYFAGRLPFLLGGGAGARFAFALGAV